MENDLLKNAWENANRVHVRMQLVIGKQEVSNRGVMRGAWRSIACRKCATCAATKAANVGKQTSLGTSL